MPVPAGRAFTGNQVREIERLLQAARTETGLRFSVWVGQAPEQVRRHARRLHAALGREAPAAVLVAVDPVVRRLEIVTGVYARHRLDDRTCALAAMSMTSAFDVGDLTGGITTGINMLRDHARRMPILHEHTPEP